MANRRPAYAKAWRIIRIAAVIARRRLIASADRSPCFHIPLPCPLGAPGEAPPCILHLVLPVTAGPLQGVPRRVRAPQRRQAWAKGIDTRQSGTLRKGLSLDLGSAPTG